MDDLICAVTGHRTIDNRKMDYVNQRLRAEIMQAIDDGYTHFISGFAEGVDLTFASIVMELQEKYHLILEAAIPYRSRIKSKNEMFQTLITKCNIVGIHSEKYHPNCFFMRNRYMVECASRIIAVYDGREIGGTRYTLQYAYEMNKEIKQIHV